MDDYRLAGVGAYLLVFCFSMDIGMLAHFIWRCFYKLHSTNGPSEKSPLFTILNSGFIKKQCCIQIELALARFEIHMCWKFTYSSINSNYSHHTIHPSNASFIWIIWMECIYFESWTEQKHQMKNEKFAISANMPTKMWV